MFSQIAYYQIGEFSVLVIMGILTILSLFFTASIPYFNKKGYWRIPMVWHFRLARVTLALAFIHGFLAIGSRFF